ncbi:MAG: heavy-metal-associated domain-containing protein [Solirubrobacteraceae bacterium]
MTEKTYTVVGMTCDHCALSVREEISEIAGVETVDVELRSGRVVVHGENVSDAAVETAVEAAGYELGAEVA